MSVSGAVGLLAIVSFIFPIIALIAAIYFFFEGMMNLALFFFIWWILWAE